MATLVLTVIGDDRSGLVSALSGVIAANGGSWERSQMARLAGKFAGIVLVAVPDDRADELIRDLQPLLPRLSALGSLYEMRGEFLVAADIYATVTRYVDSRAHLDLAFDALMRQGFCARAAGAFEAEPQGLRGFERR